MKPWQFKQKGPGFGISKGFYVSVLSATAALPSIDQVISPQPVGDVVEGFGAPLASGATKDDLHRPMERGAYVLSTRDRRTVLKMLVVPKEEAGYDPEPLLRSQLAAELSRETVERIGATWTLLQLTFETHHPMVYDSVRFVLRVAQRLALLTQGVVADPIAQTYKLPEEVFHKPQADPKIDARDVVRVHRRRSNNVIYCHTLGLFKFALAELEIPGVEDHLLDVASSLLYSASQKILLGELLEVGDRVGSRIMPLVVATGGFDRAQWEGILVFELLPPPGKSISEALTNWASEQN